MCWRTCAPFPDWTRRSPSRCATRPVRAPWHGGGGSSTIYAASTRMALTASAMLVAAAGQEAYDAINDASFQSVDVFILAFALTKNAGRFETTLENICDKVRRFFSLLTSPIQHMMGEGRGGGGF